MLSHINQIQGITLTQLIKILAKFAQQKSAATLTFHNTNKPKRDILLKAIIMAIKSKLSKTKLEYKN